MSLGLSSKFDILQQSPLDLRTTEDLDTEQVESARASRWVASRYNVQVTTGEGQLIVWNTFRGSISVFRPEQNREVHSLLTRRGFEAKPEGLVKYLFDRGLLVQEGTDEYRRFQYAFGEWHYRSSALNLTLLSSEDCNFRCQYCYEKFAHGTMLPEVRAAVRRFVEDRLPRLRYLEIGWFGGEPLYGFPAIEELAPFFHEATQERGIEYASHVTTNGYLLTPEIAEKLLSWKILHYQVTIDGPPGDHDRNRPARDGSGTFATIFENLTSLSRRPEKFIADVRVNFDQENYVHMDEFLDLLEREVGADPRFKLRFRPVGRWGGDNDKNLRVWERGDATQIRNQLVAEARRRGLASCDDLRLLNGFGSQVCYAARPFHFLIGATGKVMKCTVALDMREDNIVGKLTPEGKLELDPDKVALWVEPSFESDPKCRQCVILPLCQGVACPLIRIRDRHSPCPPLRKSFKSELLLAHEAGRERGRTHRIQDPRLVSTNHQDSGTASQSAASQGAL